MVNSLFSGAACGHGYTGYYSLLTSVLISDQSYIYMVHSGSSCVFPCAKEAKKQPMQNGMHSAINTWLEQLQPLSTTLYAKTLLRLALGDILPFRKCPMEVISGCVPIILECFACLVGPLDSCISWLFVFSCLCGMYTALNCILWTRDHSICYHVTLGVGYLLQVFGFWSS